VSPGSLQKHPEVPPVTTVPKTEDPPIPRVDAARNRRRLLDVALAEFTAADGPVALETIARKAGVGIGTLYRHFPSREALVEAVYRSELERLCQSADDLLAELPPDAALRVWMRRYADFVTTKRGMAEALRAVIAAGAVTSSQTREQLAVAVGAMLAAGSAAGMLRADVPAEDVVASLAGILSAASSSEQVDRLIDLLADGLRAQAVARCGTGMPVAQGNTRPNCTSSP
jgi:AcrR family transcriptional regulator